jgi:hypothetical protein
MNMFSVDEIWMALTALGGSIPHDSILESAERNGLYLTGMRSRRIPANRLGELARDLGVYIDPSYLERLYSDNK